MHSKKRMLFGRLILAVAIVAVFLISAEGILAADTTIFDNQVLAGSKYTTSTGDAFSIASAPPLDKIAIDLPGESFIVENNSCSNGKKFRGCYNGAKFKGYNYTLPDRVVYEFSVKLTLFAPDIKIAKLIEKPSVDVGEGTTVYVNISNAGTATGTVYYSEKIPLELKIVELPDQLCQLSHSNTLSMIADLDSGQLKRCNYKVVPASPGTYSLVSTAEFDSVKRESVEGSSSLTVKTLPVAINSTYPQEMPLGKKFSISLLLSSSDEVESLVFNAFIPKGIKVISVGKIALTKVDKSGLRILYGDAFTKLNGSTEIKINAEATNAGVFFIESNATWLYNDLKQKMAAYFPVNVTLAGPYIRLVKFDNQTMAASIDVVNPSHLPIYNTTVISTAFSGSNGQALHADSISSLSHASFGLALGSASTGNYTGTIFYYTQYGQALTAESSLPLNSSSKPGHRMVEEQKAPESGTPAMQPKAEQPQQPVKDEKDEGKTSKGGFLQRLLKPKPNTQSQFRAAVIVVAIIVFFIVIFSVIKGRKELALQQEGENIMREKIGPGSGL
ncbi:hypothetical protein HYY73_05305 [Candidatus Woesearchaeota archaeon]|nr:hypothetical protein [Candidatus Woesearchaeota archaeon]